ncbi:hypothetical protein V8E53_000647 [Lactarius tabidus]
MDHITALYPPLLFSRVPLLRSWMSGGKMGKHNNLFWKPIWHFFLYFSGVVLPAIVFFSRGCPTLQYGIYYGFWKFGFGAVIGNMITGNQKRKCSVPCPIHEERTQLDSFNMLGFIQNSYGVPFVGLLLNVILVVCLEIVQANDDRMTFGDRIFISLGAATSESLSGPINPANMTPSFKSLTRVTRRDHATRPYHVKYGVVVAMVVTVAHHLLSARSLNFHACLFAYLTYRLRQTIASEPDSRTGPWGNFPGPCLICALWTEARICEE